jgi:NAD(P)-dependent dehydrogenase (short-subunit alcohol dehydrogenase family)
MPIPSSPRAVVTGGASGLGRAFCLELAARRAKILIADRDLAGAEETAAMVAANGGTAHAVPCDVARPEQVEALVALADEKIGGVDLVINNAGVAVAGPVGDVPLENWEWITSINYWGVVYGCHFFLPRLKAQGSGHVLNVASSAGLLSAPEMAPYNMTKAAVVALTETLAGELAGTGVGATALCPTFFLTNIHLNSRRTGLADGMDGAVVKRMADSKQQAGDVARAALDACNRGQLYVIPMSDGRWGWRMKRYFPERFYKMMPGMLASMRERAARQSK